METSRGGLQNWLFSRRSQISWGFLFGLLWGFTTFGDSAPRAQVSIDQVSHLVTINRASVGSPITISEDVYSQTYASNLIQVAVAFFVLCLVGGWVAWQLSRIRPRGQPQPRLGEGWFVFFVVYWLSGAGAIGLFQALHLGDWFIGDPPTAAVIVTALFGFLLPLFDGFGAFFVWFLRLPSPRAPDWETHIPPYRDWVRPLLRDLVRRVRSGGKGGVKIE